MDKAHEIESAWAEMAHEDHYTWTTPDDLWDEHERVYTREDDRVELEAFLDDEMNQGDPKYPEPLYMYADNPHWTGVYAKDGVHEAKNSCCGSWQGEHTCRSGRVYRVGFNYGH